MNQRVRTPLAMVRVLRVLVVDGLAPERRRLVDMLAEQPGIDIAGETADLERASELAASVLPDIVLLAANLDSAPQSEIVAKLHAAAPEILFVDQNVARMAVAAQSDDVRMLQEEQLVVDGPRSPLLDEAFLQRQGIAVGNDPERPHRAVPRVQLRRGLHASAPSTLQSKDGESSRAGT